MTWWGRRGRTALWALALVLGQVQAAAADGGATPEFEDPAARLQSTELDNGLVVLTLEDHSTPVVSFQIWVDVGSGDEARFTGLAHLFEHMMFRGSKHLEPEAHQRLLEQRGARLNAFTSRDVTVYFADVTRENLPLVIELEAERLRFLDVGEDSLKSERQVVIEERRLRTEDNPEGRLFEQLMALVFQAHPYRVPTIGWRSDLEKMGVPECREFFDQYYAANNLVVSVVGDFDTRETLEQIRRHLGPLRTRENVPRNPQTEPEQRGERRAVVHYDVRAPILAMAWHAPPTGHADGEALDVMSTILSSGRTSRLYRRMVHEEPLALGASASYWELERAGVLYAFSSLRPGVSIDQAEAVFLEELERLRREPPTPEELEKAKRRLEVGLIDGQGTSHAIASRLGRDWLAFGRVRPLAERLAAIQRVTREDVRRVAQTYLQAAKRTVLHMVPAPEEGS
ncbi:MAG: pitrilysin family protein [Planctomycetota bacterium]|jgi:zinc protease|nr:peptidase M16 [Deltaproteobacteria bacterium]MDP6540559.1 pitrilysin family protein [Planctomycetota bacterium]